MTLTKDERFTAYCIMLAEAEENFFTACMGFGFCGLVRFEFDIDNRIYDQKFFYLLFPELFALKPNRIGRFWFSTDSEGWQKRIELLKQCINETAPE